jgi:hypothetical protein
MSIHCTPEEIGEIQAAAAASGMSRNRFVKALIKREIERSTRALPAVAPALEVAE